jgi:uncharacterized protein (DUF1330 family)
MKGYLIANLDVRDQPNFQRYREEVVPLIHLVRWALHYQRSGGRKP